MAFIAYPHTPDFIKYRKELNRDYLGYPRKGTFFGTVKIHGTNATIVITPSTIKAPQYQSRNKIITISDDNARTAKFLSEVPLAKLVDEILSLRGVTDFEEIYICGEYAGRGIQKGVGVASLNPFFAIFNIRIDGHWVDLRRYRTVHLPSYRVYSVANFETFEVDIDFDDEEATAATFDRMKTFTLEVVETCPVAKEIAQLGQVATPSKADKVVWVGGVGIVWSLVPTPGFDTQLLNFKTKGDQFLPTNTQPAQPSRTAADAGQVEAFVDFALGDRRLEQGIEYLKEMGHDPSDMKSLPTFMSWVAKDVIKEEGWRLSEPTETGATWLELGVTETKVSKAVATRAKAWFVERRNK
ncbi:hypothetical protein FRC17_009512 [Serendipita sp. 399]|nr:hypothetical protein FRC17_009512 [Serendipita sp. 399]